MQLQVLALSGSQRAHSTHADEALKETLRTMAADLIPGACIRIPVIGSGIDQAEVKEAPAFRAAMTAALRCVVEHVQRRKAQALAEGE
jgi:NAD(P)H-dependent FMN reductase